VRDGSTMTAVTGVTRDNRVCALDRRRSMQTLW